MLSFVYRRLIQQMKNTILGTKQVTHGFMVIAVTKPRSSLRSIGLKKI